MSLHIICSNILFLLVSNSSLSSNNVVLQTLNRHMNSSSNINNKKTTFYTIMNRHSCSGSGCLRLFSSPV
jgi:hypothetical protein